jgi:hypothetical protein
VSVEESKEGRESISAQPDRLLARRLLVVVTNNRQDERTSIEAHPDVPKRYDPYQTDAVFDPRLVVRSVNARQRTESPYVWDVLVEYDSEYELRDNPFSEPPDIRYESEVYDLPLPGRAATSYDYNSQSPQSEDPVEAGDQITVWGQGITTSAGELFDPPPTDQRSRPIIRFIRNEPNITVAYKVRYENTVNQVPWSGLQARQAWLRSITASSHVQKSSTVGQPDVFYARVEYVFALKAETWDLILLDIGSYYIDWSSGSAIKRAFKVEGSGEPRLGLLDHSNPDELGSRLASDQPAQFLRWRTKREETFSNLGINLDLALSQRRARPRKGA